MTKLWCYIEGERTTFSVTISPDCTVDDLKKQIHNVESLECGPRRLTLTKVRYIMISM